MGGECLPWGGLVGGGGMTGRQARVCASLSGSPGWGQMIVWEWAAADTGLLA